MSGRGLTRSELDFMRWMDALNLDEVNLPRGQLRPSGFDRPGPEGPQLGAAADADPLVPLADDLGWDTD